MPRYEGAPDWQRAESAYWRARMAAIEAYRATAVSGAKYKPNERDKELIGIADAVLFWSSESGVDNSTDDAGDSGLHKYIFDTTTRADAAQVKLLNDSGVTQYLTGCVIKAKPIVRLSGEQAFVHEDFVDQEDIATSGERLFEFGNNYVVTAAQLAQLADYFAKALGVLATGAVPSKAKHLYGVILRGRWYHLEPGEWYTLQIGGEGQREYINCVAECYSMRVQTDPRSAGTTQAIFREVEQGWVKDSNALARFLATGDPRWKPTNFGRLLVAAKNNLETANYYCDGSVDETEIQAAINNIGKCFGGGVVELSEGQFNTTACIDASYNGLILQGHGAQTIISKTVNDYGLKIVGTSGTYKDGIMIQDMKITRPAGDTNAKPLVYLQYAKNVILENLVIDDSYDDGIVIENCKNIKLVKCIINSAGVDGVVIKQTLQAAILSCLIASNTGIGCKLITDDITDLIDHGDCESLDEPMLTGETIPYTQNCTWARSNEQAHGGTYSYKMTMGAGAATAYAAFTDSVTLGDLHGVTAGKTYRFGAWLYIPTAGNLNYSEIFMIFKYDDGTYDYSYIPFQQVKDVWQEVIFIKEIPAASTTFYITMGISLAASNGDYLYVDDVVLYEGDYENNGYIVNDCTIRDNIGHGIYVATNEAQILGSRLIDNDAISLYIAGGDKNKVHATSAVRDGDYTAATNFYDGGTNTEAGI